MVQQNASDLAADPHAPRPRRYGEGDVRFFDRVAGAYDRLSTSPPTTELRAAFDRAERPVERVLDLAGGTGRVSTSLRTEGYDPIVADASRGMLARARAAGHETVQVDAGTLPLRGDCVDAAVVVDAYHHLPDQRAAMAEATRVVAPGGVVVVRDVDPSTFRGRVVDVVEGLVGMASRLRSPDQAAASLTRAGTRSRVLERGFFYTVVGVVPGDDPTRD